MQRWMAVGLVVSWVSLAAAGDLAVRFVDTTKQRNLACRHAEPNYSPSTYEGHSMLFGVGAAVADYDRDGDLDVYVCNSYLHRDTLMRNQGDGTFVDETAGSGLHNYGHGAMALFLDLDNDGWDDLIVANEMHSEYNEFPGSQLYRNNRDGTFTDVTFGSGITFVDSSVGGMTASDYDKDGRLDVLIVGWFNKDVRLFKNEGGFVFRDVTPEADLLDGIVDRPYYWAPLFVDLDNDGWQDIYFATDFTADYVLRNNQDGTFSNVAAAWNMQHVANDMGVAVADFDNDGDLDLYTTNVSGSETCDTPGGCNALYVNRLNEPNGRFEYEQVQRGVGDTGWSWGTWFFDAELDGDRDLLVVNGWAQPEWQTPAKLFLNDGTGNFQDVGADAGAGHVGNTRAMLPVDLDQDGDFDFLTFDVFGTSTFYENQSDRRGNHWLTVEARGVASNRNGVGARVYVTAGGRTQMAEIVAGGSFRAGPQLNAHFGLGQAATADVRVVFPNGRERTLRGVKVDRKLIVTEPKGR